MWTRGIPGLIAVLLIAACADSPGAAPPTTQPSTQPSAQPSAPPATSPPAAPSVPATPSTAPPASDATAADGTRLAACADGTCEVAVSRPARIKLRTGTLRVIRVVADDEVEIKMSLRNGGGGSGTLRGTCGTISYFFAGGGRGEFCADATAAPKQPRPARGEVALQLAGWTADGAAVLRVVTR
ncbi:hypothetical protein AB0M20_43990 [Actinoplanes sp. NPDC051633]|uniref:hypothetical protein n=1 Tax=Actinoplanes sp. NPDC051633 TaxID=3155670 RepID=UPI00343A7BA4